MFCPSRPEPPMQRIFFIDIINTMLLDNQFLSPEERALFHLKTIIHEQHSPHYHLASRFAQTSLNKLLTQIQTGLCSVSENSREVADLIEVEEVAVAEQEREEKRRRMEIKQLKNSLLYDKNKNKQTSNQKCQQLGLFSVTQHLKFVKEMKKKNSLSKLNRTKLHQQQEAERQAELASQRQMSQAARMLEIEKRKQAIKESLKKMRQNHLFVLQQQQQSKKLFNKANRKKRLYQKMKQCYDEIATQMLTEKQERAMRERERLNKLNLHQILAHQKQYEEWRKKQRNQMSRGKEISQGQVPPAYQPPPHSDKISQFLSEEAKYKNRVQASKRLATEKLHRIAQYTSVVREKFKPKSPPANPSKIEKGKSFGQLGNKKSHYELGNQYLKQAKLIIRKRSKTEERSLNPEKVDSSRQKHDKPKSRTTTLNYLPERRKKEYVERMKREQIESILKEDCQNEAQRLQRLRLADERLSRELHKKQAEMKLRYSTENRQNTLALLLGTIKAKISLIDSYNTRDGSHSKT